MSHGRLYPACPHCGGVLDGRHSCDDHHRALPCVMVTGSRAWTDRAAITTALVAVTRQHGKLGVIHGGAAGADTIAAAIARRGGHQVQAFLADWEHHGRRAGILRNLRMLDESPMIVLAFQVGASRGTQHAIDQATRRGLQVDVHRA